MGLLLKVGINLDLIKTAFLAFFSIGFLIISINFFPFLKKLFPNYSLQFAGLIGNTSFLGIPIAIALLPSSTLNFSIGFDVGTTFFAWLFGPILLQKKINYPDNFKIKNILEPLFNNPSSKGIIAVLTLYLFGLEDVLGNYLWIPARIVIFFAIMVVGARLGIITNKKNDRSQNSEGSIYVILLKLFIFPLIIFLISKTFNFNNYGTMANVLQAGTPSAISTILMAEAYKMNQSVAAKILFSSTLISIITIPALSLLINYLAL